MVGDSLIENNLPLSREPPTLALDPVLLVLARTPALLDVLLVPRPMLSPILLPRLFAEAKFDFKPVPRKDSLPFYIRDEPHQHLHLQLLQI